MLLNEPKNLWIIFTADSDSVCEGSNPSPAAKNHGGTAYMQFPVVYNESIVWLFIAWFVVLPDLVPVPAPYCAILQGLHHVVNENNVFVLAGQTLYLSFAFHLP